MLRTLSSPLKRLLTFIAAGSTSIFIAACYGAPNMWERLRIWTIKAGDSSGAPIRGIRLTVRDLRQTGGSSVADTLYTDSLGVAEYTYMRADGGSLSGDSTFAVLAEDVDSAANGGPYRPVERGLPNQSSDTVRITMEP